MAATPPHKPRRRAKKAESDVSATPTPSTPRGSVKPKAPKAPSQPTYPLAAFLWPARASSGPWETLPLILMAVGLFRWAAGLWGYSGFQKPPMHGDYEAQRHWMEITTHLPISQWYFHDLDWWGLDYPPLTAYHSWVLGKIGGFIKPSWFALYDSRGLDDEGLKVFMRATVIVSEYLIYIPAVVIFVRRFSRLHSTHFLESSMALVAILMQPATILIDHVHFQYNTVMLGLVVASMSSMLAGRLLWSCVFFVLALGFKQMALYYAPAVFAYLLGVCVFPRINVPRFLSIAVITAISFTVLVAPLILGAYYDKYRGISAQPSLFGYAAALPIFSFKVSPKAWYYPLLQQTAQLLHRIFPFARGLFEDKVANFWCALNVLIKLKTLPAALLQRFSLLLTLIAIFPPCLIIFLVPSKRLLPLTLATTAWAFFLFSFQVHEKSALLPLMPMTLLLASSNGLSKQMRAWIGFANMLGVWTMFPLLKRVDLRIPYAVLSLLWAYLLGLPPTSLKLYDKNFRSSWQGLGTAVLHGIFYFAMLVWHVVEATLEPPRSKPDLWVVVNVGVGAAGFGICYVWCLWSLSMESGLAAQLKRGSVAESKKVKTR